MVASTEDAAREDALELADPSEHYLWEEEWGVDVFLREADPDKVPKGSYIWSGGASGKEVTVDQVHAILAESPERLPEIPGQEAFSV